MKVLLFSLIAGLFILTAGFRINQQPKPWPVPDKAAKNAQSRQIILRICIRPVRHYGISIVLPVMAKQD